MNASDILESLLRARNGPMTSQLVQRPADFGLGRVPARLTPAGATNMVCGFCSTGCSLRVHLNDAGEAINLSPDPDYPVNLGMACPKGWEALAPLAAPDRVLQPLARLDRAGDFRPLSWPDALDLFCRRLKEIQRRHGPASVAVLSTGQIVVEEMALLGALAKFGMGITELDSNTRQCMATSHVAYKQSFGFDAPPYTYADFEESDVLVFIGANPCIAHPIMWQRVQRNRRNPEIIVIDPRRTETAMCASLHLPLRPKSDLTLLYGLAHLLVAHGWINRDFIAAHTTGFDDFAAFVRDFPPMRVAAATGLPEDTLRQVARLIGTRERVSLWWTMGVNQGHEATRTAQAVINLALMTGNVGRPGTGANSITGQCNAMGSRLFGNATSLLGGHDFASPDHRARVASVLGLDPGLIPPRPSRAYDQILDAVDAGEIRALWIIATNPAHSWINQHRFGALRDKLDFLVVQDMYATTETSRQADLVLPAAGWGEKDGVLINSERRLGLVKKVARAPGEALSDFQIFKLIAEAWGCGSMFRAWDSPEAAFRLLQELSRGRPCDFSGIRGYAQLEASGGIQWPWPEDDDLRSAERGRLGAGAGSPAAGSPLDESTHAGAASPGAEHSAFRPQPSAAGASARERRLFADGRFFTPDGRARFVFDAPRPLPEPPDAEYPLLLLTGRGSSSQWHTGSRTDKSDVLRKLAPTQLYVEINPQDAARLRISDGDRVRICSRRGRAEAFAVMTPTVQPGQVFLPMHFPSVNRLTHPSFDPHSRQPGYKACAVAVERLNPANK